MQKITIVDIARLAGVGTTTVSRYFNNGRLKEETRKKVQKVVEKYNYTPNTFARALKSIDSKIIGVVVPTLSSYIVNKSLSYIDKKLKDSGYETLIMNSDIDGNLQLEYLKKLVRMNVDGIIILPTSASKDYEDVINSINIPVVILGQDSGYTYNVQYDDFNAGLELGNYIISRGHRKIAFLGLNKNASETFAYRQIGVSTALAKYNFKLVELDSNFSHEESYKSIKNNIKKLEDTSCLICATDNLAYGAIKALEEYGICSGKNYSVAGFGDYELSPLLKSPLTTVNFDVKKASWKAVNNLLKVLKKEKIDSKTLIGYELIIRESVLDINENNLT